MMVGGVLLRPGTLVPLMIFSALAILPLAGAEHPFWMAFFARFMIYAIAASGLNLALGIAGLVSFGHALFLGIGAYAVGILSFNGSDNGWLHLGVCVGVSAATALVTCAISLRTVGIAFIMITLAFAQMGYFFFVSLKQYGGDDGLPIVHTSRFGPVDLGSPSSVYVVSLGLLVLLTWWIARLRVAPFGMALRAAQQNSRRVDAMGLNAKRYRLVAYGLSGSICGVAGLLLANLDAFASPSTVAWNVSGELIAMVVLGGSGSVFGPMLGALVYLALAEGLKGYTDHWMALFGLLVAVIAIVGKHGLAGVLQRFEGPRAVGDDGSIATSPLKGLPR